MLLLPLTKLGKCSDQFNWKEAVYRPFTGTNKALIISLTTFKKVYFFHTLVLHENNVIHTICVNCQK